MRIVRLLPALIVLLLLTGPAAALGTLPAYLPGPCPMTVPAGVHADCGTLVVPEDRANPASPAIKLAVAILRSPSPDPVPDPLIYLAGGPGGYLLDSIDYYAGAFAPYLRHRDVILLDQRGVGYSQPALDCPELQAIYYSDLSEHLSVQDQISQEVDAATRCSTRLRNSGVDLAAYNSAASAADVADLRTVLGYDQWNLLGISYGTRLALTVMRDHPEGVRSVILDSVVPLQADGLADVIPAANRAFSMLFNGCAADSACNTAFPNLENRFWALVDRLNANPASITANHPTTDKPYTVLIDGNLLIDTLFRSLYSTELITYMPAIIDLADSGVYDPLANLALYFIADFETFSVGMYYSANCHDDDAFSSLDAVNAEVARFPRIAYMAAASESEYAVCGIWGAGVGAPIENQPVRSDIPTLVVSGEYDPITPPERGAQAAETLSHSFVFEFPGLGHGVTLAGDCPMNVSVAFLDDPATEPDSSCIAGMSGPDFVTR